MDEKNKNSTKSNDENLVISSPNNSSEYEKVSFLQNSINKKKQEISKIMSSRANLSKSIRDQEANRSINKHQLENDQQQFFLELKQTRDKLDHEYVSLTSEYSNLGERLLLILKRSDNNQQLIDHMKAQEKDYERLEITLQNQMIHIETIIESMESAVLKGKLPRQLNQTSKLIENKSKEIADIQSSIQTLNHYLTEMKEKKKNFLQKSKELKNEITKTSNAKRNEKFVKYKEAAHKTKMKYFTINRQKEKIYHLKTHISLAYGRLTEVLSEMSDLATYIESQTKKLNNKSAQLNQLTERIEYFRLKTIQTSKRNNYLEKNYNIYNKVHSKNEKTMQKLKGECSELSNSYKIETKLNKLLPKLLKEDQDLDHNYEEMKQDIRKVEETIEQYKNQKYEYDSKLSKLNAILNPLEENIKRARAEEEEINKMLDDDSLDSSDYYKADDASSLLPPEEKEIIDKRQESLKKCINSIKKKSRRVMRRIQNVKNQMAKQYVSHKSLIKIMNDHNISIGKLKEAYEYNNSPMVTVFENDRIKKLKQAIRNLEILIEAKKNVINERKISFYEKSSLFIHTIHQNNRKEIASTNSIAFDLITKSLILKNHDEYCGIQHEKEAYNVMNRCKNQPKCPYCDIKLISRPNLAVL